MKDDIGFETISMMDAEWTEHDKPSKRYDKFGQTLERFRRQIPKRNPKRHFYIDRN